MNKNISNALKIVTVEDSLLVVERLRNMLLDLKDVEFTGNATNITDAIRLIGEQNPAVVILDIHLKENAPYRNGLDLLATLRSYSSDMTIIVFSNMAIQQYRDKCAALGANYFFDKSTDFELVIETLKDITSKRK